MSGKVLVTADGLGDAGMKYFEDRNVAVFTSSSQSTEEELLETAAREEVDIIIVRRATITPPILDASPNLKGIIKVGAGVDSIDVAGATKRGMVVCNGAGLNAPAVAELALTLILSVARKIVPLDAEMRRNVWSQGQYQSGGLFGQTVGIVGLGHIGRKLADMVRPFEVRLCAYSPNAPREAFGEDIESMDSLEELLRISDIVSLHTPSRPDTFHMFNKDTFALMKPNAIFVNTGRGSVVDEAALAEALHAGTIAGAGLDVFDPEPPAADNPLLTAPNTVLVPHVSSRTALTVNRTAEQAAITACRIIDGQRPEPRFVINPEVYGNNSA